MRQCFAGGFLNENGEDEQQQLEEDGEEILFNKEDEDEEGDQQIQDNHQGNIQIQVSDQDRSEESDNDIDTDEAQDIEISEDSDEQQAEEQQEQDEEVEVAEQFKNHAQGVSHGETNEFTINFQFEDAGSSYLGDHQSHHRNDQTIAGKSKMPMQKSIRGQPKPSKSTRTATQGFNSTSYEQRAKQISQAGKFKNDFESNIATTK